MRYNLNMKDTGTMRSGSQPPSAEGDSGEGRERSEDEQRPLRQVCSGDRPFSTSATGTQIPCLYWGPAVCTSHSAHAVWRESGTPASDLKGNWTRRRSLGPLSLRQVPSQWQGICEERGQQPRVPSSAGSTSPKTWG